MATNAPRSLQVFDPVLTGIARSYRPSGWVGDRLLAQVPVSKLSGQYPVFDKAFWFRNVDNQVQDRSPAPEIDFEWSTEQYLAREYALKVGITDLEREQAIAELRLESNKTDFLTNAMVLAHEVRVANLLRKTTNGGQLNLGATVSTKWDDRTTQATTPTIETDIRTGVLAIYDATGLNPNVIVIPFKVAYAMALDTKIRELLRYDAAGKPVNFIELGGRVLPSVIHGMNVVIAQGPQVDSSNPGGTSSISEIWSDSVRLLYVNPGAGWGTPTVAYKFVHKAKTVTKWRQTDPDIDYIRQSERYDLKVVAADAGYEINDVMA